MIESCLGAMILCVWFLTEFRTHIFNTIYRRDLNHTNIQEFIALKFNRDFFGFSLGGMLNCPLCLGFWIAAVLSLLNPIMIPVHYIGQTILFLIIRGLNRL